MMMAKLEDVLDYFDKLKITDFSFHSMDSAIRNLPDDILNSEISQYELLALNFVENAGDIWNTFYGPMISSKNEKGEEFIYPNMKDITSKCIEYWILRAKKTKNLYLKIRYLGLIVDFQQTVTNVRVNYNETIVPYVESIVKIVSEGCYKDNYMAYCFIEQAMNFSATNTTLFPRCFSALCLLDERCITDESVACWSYSFKLFLRYYDKLKYYENKIINDNLQRFFRLEKYSMGLDGDKYVHSLFVQCQLLCDYYKQEKKSNEIADLILRTLKCIRNLAPQKGCLWATYELDKIQKLYRKYNLDKYAIQLNSELQDTGKGAIAEMKRIEVPLNIDMNEIDKNIDDLFSGTIEHVLLNFFLFALPNIEFERELKSKGIGLFAQFARTTLYDSNGTSLYLGEGPKGEFNILMHSMYQNMLYTSFIIRIIIEKMIDKQLINKEKLMSFFSESPLFQGKQGMILDRGLDAYFNGDYLVACHLLIPQFENAIRQMVKINNGVTLKDRSDGQECLSLDKLLDDEALKPCFSNDVLLYFKNLFTNSFGWNLRNRVAHGLLDYDSFNVTVADRVVHAFIILGFVKLKPRKYD